MALSTLVLSICAGHTGRCERGYGMDTKERRAELLRLLQADDKPMSASSLGEHFGVSRQIIVGDIALLRASGADILATPRGYLLNQKEEEAAEEDEGYVVVCNHDKVQLEEEFYAIIDNGGQVLNVSVEHPIYGTITQPLDIKSRYEADKLLNKIAMSGAKLLCSLTDGVHLHAISCPDPESYRRILVVLKEKGILYMK